MTIRSINTSGLPQGVLTPMGDLLFAASEPGAWYDPSDLPTLFQDTAGTTPVTAVEQPVGLILDKSGRGNHASQATSTKRPIYSRRVNLLVDTEAFNTWGAVAATVDSNVAMSPIGTLTADRVNFSASTNSGVSKTINTIAAPVVMSVWARSEAGTRTFRLWSYNATDGVVSSPDFVATTTWQKFTVAIPRTVNTSSWYIYNATSGPTAGTLLIWGASITLSTDSHLPYQRVNTDPDYDADPAKFPAYLRFDGIDDVLSTGNIDFTGTSKMTVWAGATSLDMGATLRISQVIVASLFGGFNSFAIVAPNNAGFTSCASGGSAGLQQAPESGLGSAPRNLVLTLVADQVAPYDINRRDGVQRSNNTGNQGATGGYGNRPTTIGGDASNRYLSGRIYSVIVRGAQSSLSQIEAAELYTRRRMMLP